MSQPVPDPPGSPIPVLDSPRALLTDPEFNSVRMAILNNNYGMAPEMAGAILEDALAFVATAARNPGVGLVPSRVVDEGWHALILHTSIYWNLCLRFGNFVHHIPEPPDAGRWDEIVIRRTIAHIEAAGYPVHHSLWRGPEDSTVPVAAQCQHGDQSGPIVTQPRPKPKG
jgi:hypothetical protein